MVGYVDNKAGRQQRLKLVKIWYSLGALMLLLVAVVSLTPVPDVGVSDKLSHVITYLLLAGWFGLLAANRAALGWTIVGLIAFGILIEGLQGMTAYRYAEWGDVVANGTGIVTGILVYFTPLPRILRFVDTRLALILLR